ncbi:hypothetical protein, partial [Actinomadura sediminis]
SAVGSGGAGSAAGAGAAAPAAGVGAGGAVSGGSVGAAGVFAGVGGKVAAGVAGAALVGGGVAAYTTGGREAAPERARPVAAAVTVQNQRLDGLPLVVRSQYVRISGHRDAAVERRINETLRSPLDWTIGRVRAATEQYRSVCVRDSVVEMTARVGVKGPSLISVLYPDNRSTLCTPADGLLPSWAVTVDVETGRAYTADDVFKPGTLTPAGIDTLLARLAYVPGDAIERMWGPNDCAADRPPRRDDFFPRDNPASGGPRQAPPYATIFFAPDRFVLNWSAEGSACMKSRMAAPYGEVRDLLKPDLAARLPT